MGHWWGQTKLKRSEGGPGVTDAVRTVNRAKLPGVRARSGESPYVGHTSMIVEATTKAGLRDALRALKRVGFIRSVRDAISNAEHSI